MRNFFILLLFVISISSLAAPEESLIQLLGNYTTYAADFKQTTLGDAGHISQQGQGRVYIKRPNQFRWETSTPNADLVILNNRILWHYDPDLMQATREHLDKAAEAQNPAFLLISRVDNLVSCYDVKLIQLKKAPWFFLTPKVKSEGYQKIYLNFNKGHLDQMIVVNNLDEKSLFQFSNVQVNQAISSSYFNFKAPKGVDLVNQ